MIHGRHAEQAAIAALVEGARSFHGGALVVRGPAGVGKSTLLDDAVGRAQDMQVLRASGVDSESALPYAGLHQWRWSTTFPHRKRRRCARLWAWSMAATIDASLWVSPD